MTTDSIHGMSRAMRMGIAAWVGIPLLHVAFMVIDWNLRDPNSIRLSGIPDSVAGIFQLSSVLAFGLLLFASTSAMRSLWARAAIAIVATGIALVVMVFGWLYYVTANGIDGP